MAGQSDYKISYHELRIAVFSVLAKLCHKPYITQDFTLGDLEIENELMFCTEFELALKKYLNRYFRNGFDFRQRFYLWTKQTSADEILRCLAWQYDVAIPELTAFERFRATHAAINNEIIARYQGQKKR